MWYHLVVKAFIFEYIGKGTLFVCTHEGICGSLGIVPLLLTLGSVCMEMGGQLDALAAASWGKSTSTHWTAGWLCFSITTIAFETKPIASSWSQTTLSCPSSPRHSTWTELSCLLFLKVYWRRKTVLCASFWLIPDWKNCIMCVILVNTWLEKLLRASFWLIPDWKNYYVRHSG